MRIAIIGGVFSRYLCDLLDQTEAPSPGDASSA